MAGGSEGVRGAKLPRSFYAGDTRAVARALLGKILVHRDDGAGGTLRAARIVETEAYHGPGDLASHARFGPTPRAGIMFGPPGFAYVYVIYGLSHCVNFVTGPEGFPAAVLIRAAEPLVACLHSTRGPGNLCRALRIRREADNGRDLEGDELYVLDDGAPVGRIVAGPRVNVAHAGRWAERRWRYAIARSAWVSRPPPPEPSRARGAAPAPSSGAAARKAAATTGPRAARSRRGGSGP